MSSECYRFNVGNFEGLVINDGSERYPPDRVVANIPIEQLGQALLELGLPSEEVKIDFNCLLVVTDDHRILVDTGLGPNVGSSPGKLLQNLQAEGIATTDIDTIILTHGDGDHIGGILDDQDKPVFSQARYIMAKAAWDFWTAEANLARMPDDVAAFGRKTLPLIRNQIDLVEPETEFLPGFRLISATGHRADHVVLLITSAGEKLLHIADTVGHPLMLASPEWYSTFDSLPEQTLVTKRRLLDWAVAEKALLFAAHFPFPGLGYVSQKGNAWGWQPLTN